MNTKERILDKSRKMFNGKGIRAVSLRDIAKSLGISYGNLTYHYSNKENLLTWIYIQMMEEHQEITRNSMDETNLLEKIMMAPEHSYDISFKYKFLYQDYIEIARNYPSIAVMQDQLNTSGNLDLYAIFLSLREQGLFRQDIAEQDIDYLVELSNYMKFFYFMRQAALSAKDLNKKSGKKEYVRFTNKLLQPYLSPKGLKIYEEIISR